MPTPWAAKPGAIYQVLRTVIVLNLDGGTVAPPPAPTRGRTRGFPGIRDDDLWKMTSEVLVVIELLVFIFCDRAYLLCLFPSGSEAQLLKAVASAFHLF